MRYESVSSRHQFGVLLLWFPSSYDSEVMCLTVCGCLYFDTCVHRVCFFGHSDDDRSWHFTDGIPCPSGIFTRNVFLFIWLVISVFLALALSSHLLYLLQVSGIKEIRRQDNFIVVLQ